MAIPTTKMLVVLVDYMFYWGLLVCSATGKMDICSLVVEIFDIAGLEQVVWKKNNL